MLMCQVSQTWSVFKVKENWLDFFFLNGVRRTIKDLYFTLHFQLNLDDAAERRLLPLDKRIIIELNTTLITFIKRNTFDEKGTTFKRKTFDEKGMTFQQI